MKKKHIISTAFAVLALAACSKQNLNLNSSENALSRAMDARVAQPVNLRMSENDGNATLVTPEVFFPFGMIPAWKTNEMWNYTAAPAAYQQLPNHDFSTWQDIADNSISLKLRNFAANWNAPKFARLKSSTGAYNANTLFGPIDPNSDLAKKGATPAQFGGATVQITSKSTTILFVKTNITGQISNAGIFADGSSEYKGFVATSNGDWTNWTTGTVFTERPNSMIVYYRYSPKGFDYASFELMLHKNGGDFDPTKKFTRMPAVYPGSATGTMDGTYQPVDMNDKTNIVGYARYKTHQACDTGTQWCKVILPIVYSSAADKPERIIVNITSSNPFNLVDGSSLEIDRIGFLYN